MFRTNGIKQMQEHICFLLINNKEYLMNQTINRHIQIDNWIFEVKMVRALKVKQYGEPYCAIANISLNGSSAYIDGMMQKDQQDISDEDVQVFKDFCQQMAIEKLNVESKNYDLTNSQIIQPMVQENVLLKLA